MKLWMWRTSPFPTGTGAVAGSRRAPGSPYTQGAATCEECMELLRRADPAEVKNYRKLTFLDRLLTTAARASKAKANLGSTEILFLWPGI